MRDPADEELALKVEAQLARTNELFSRMDRTPEYARAARRHRSRNARNLGRRLRNIGIAVVALLVATLVFSQLVGPIGVGGFVLVLAMILMALLFFAVWPGEKAVPEYREDMPNRAIVQRLDSFLVRRRAALPAPAARKADAIGRHLPLLESRLGEVDALDPLAQDARRLMGRHLPELIERYERVPPEYRDQRDGEGLTVEERLTAGLDAAHEALEDIARKLARKDLTAFETQGRFIESRYRDAGGALKGE